MKKLILIIILLISISSYSQAFYCTKTIDTSNCKIRLYNSVGVKFMELNMNYITYWKDQVGSYIIKDLSNSITIKNDGCLTTPAFSTLGSTLDSWISVCSNKSAIPPSPNAGDSLIYNQLVTINSRIDTTQVDTSLAIVIQLQNLIDSTNKLLSLAYYFDTSTIDTSLVPQIDYTSLFWSLINKGYDTSQIDTSLVQVQQLQQIIDSLSILINKKDTTHTAILATINDSVNSKFNQLIAIVDTSQQDTNTVLYTAQLDSIISLLKDTIDFEYHSFCYRAKYDSGVYEFSQVFDVKTPTTPYYMAFIDLDSLIPVYILDNGVTIGTYPNIVNDYVPCEKWDEYLKSLKTTDTVKALVFKAQTKRIDGTADTLYNCKGISFSVNTGATGNITFYYGDGDQDVYDLATEQLPNWENGSFVEFLGWNATAVAGVVRINKLGCSDVPENICAKEKPIINCSTNVPIPTCVGWASASGVWFSASGCWNTGQ